MSIESLPRIYFNSLPISAEGFPPTVSCKDRIGAVWAAFAQDRGEPALLLSKLGVAVTDTEAHLQLIPMMKTLLEGDVEIEADENVSGVFFLSVDGEKVGVFKVGEKRARMELLVRNIAHKVGLEKHAIPAVYCALANPIFPEEEVMVELWNGNVKIFSAAGFEDYNEALESPYSVVGILEPYLNSGETAAGAAMTSEEFLNMNVLAFLVGLRDGKLDGIAGSTIFDAEDCMPGRFLPGDNFNDSVAATHLPWLEHAYAETPHSVDVFQKVLDQLNTRIRSKYTFAAGLEEEKVDIADVTSEAMAPMDEIESEEREIHKDHGGCPIQIETQELIMEDKAHPKKYIAMQEDPLGARLLSQEQIDAFLHRFTNLHKALEAIIAEREPASLSQLIAKYDAFFGAHRNQLSKSPQRFHPAHLIGKYPPSRSSADGLDPEDVAQVQADIRSFGDSKSQGGGESRDESAFSPLLWRSPSRLEGFES